MAQCTKCEQPTVGKSRYCLTHRAESRANFKQMIAESSAAREKRSQDFETIWQAAVDKGNAAAAACTPVPMVVGSPTTPFGNDLDPAKPQYFVEGGVCGFAWLNFKPGNHPFVNWLKAKNLVSGRSYYGGVDYSCHEFGQSMQRKEAWTHGAGSVLKSIQGLRVQAMSRMD